MYSLVCGVKHGSENQKMIKIFLKLCYNINVTVIVNVAEAGNGMEEF